MGKRYVISGIGFLLLIVGCSMLLPAAAGLYFGEAEYAAFLQSAAVTLMAGLALAAVGQAGQKRRRRVGLVDSYALVVYGWLASALFAMLPYLFSGTLHGITDAFFETMSGLTTVSATVIRDVEQTARCVLLWRSLTQWLGGMGLLVLFVALLSNQGGAAQLFRAESAGPVKNRLTPRIADTARSLWFIYLGNTLAVIALYLLGGMGLFDAVNHAFSVIATGGFSTRNGSIGAYDSPILDWITVIAMFLAGVNYALYFHMLRSRSLRCFWQSLEFRVYLGVALGATLLEVCLIAPGYGYHWGEALRYGAFQVVSILTTTGLVNCDFEQWVPPAQLVLLLLMLCGACAGSTSSGIKIDRYVILARKAKQEVLRFLHPRMVTRLKSNGRLVEDEVVLSALTFFYIYLLLVAAGTYLICLFGADIRTSLSAVLSCLGGVGGPTFGAWGPTETYAAAPAAAKWVLVVLMLAGRLELYTLLVLLLPLGRVRRRRARAEKQDFEAMEEDAVVEPMVRDK